MSAPILGALLIAVPALVLAWLVLRRIRPVLWFAVALIVVGTGYLTVTGATGDIAMRLAPGWIAAAPAR